MNFSFPNNYHWYITKDYKKVTTANLIQVVTYEDSARSKLALKKDSFIGIFDSIEELNKTMANENYVNIESLNLNSEMNFREVGLKILDLNQNINKIEFQFYKDGHQSNALYNPNFLRIENLNEIYTKTKKAFIEFTNGEISLDSKLELNEEKYLTVDLSNWNQSIKDILFTDCLQGIYYYYSIHSNKKSFDIGTYNSVIQAINGNAAIQIYKESIKWFTKEVKEKLIHNKYSFPNLKKSSNNYYDSRETFNDTYYNDQLDMDQQSPEFWDSL